MKAALNDLMNRTGVRFGTSGARGLADELTDLVASAYTQGFLQYLIETGELPATGSEVAVAGDFRPSTDRIMEAVMRGIEALGHTPINCGKIPSPAVALYGLNRGVPAIMVTGSHIPADRNGIKFNKCSGEVLKADEPGICRQIVTLDDCAFDPSGAFTKSVTGRRPVSNVAIGEYFARYRDFFPGDCLKGLRLGVYQHSAVARDLLVSILQSLGAEVTALGRSETFVPVDTEAIRPEDVELARGWATEHQFDAILSADGDSDRPLISDERGRWIRGDVAGILCARYLGADSVSTPVSCNSAVDLCGWFKEVRRTKIGSPFVVSSMLDASARGFRCVVGYEANGGFLLNSDLAGANGKTLGALPTRDAVILHLSLLLLARREGRSLSQLVATLPPRYTASGLLKNCSIEKSQAILAQFTTGNDGTDRAAMEHVFGPELGSVKAIDRTDGIRATFENGEILHLRPSGNAPEFRCYTEASDEGRAQQLNHRCKETIARLAAG